MALDPIWQQQLCLVSYGNQFLQQSQPIEPWLQHAIFYNHQLEFRDLQSHALIAQHFKIWLQGLKAQGVRHLSLHPSQLLLKDKNPNCNVLLIDTAPVIVSHGIKTKSVWILGQDLPQWDTDNTFRMPPSQSSNIQIYQLWRYELNKKHHKAILRDLNKHDWDALHGQLQQNFISPALVQGFIEPTQPDSPFYGSTLIEKHPDDALMHQIQILPILPSTVAAPLAHEWLHRASALQDWLHENPNAWPTKQMQHWHNTMMQLIVAIANHYPSAALTRSAQPVTSAHQHSHVSSMTVWKILLLMLIICVAGYYFGF